MAALVIGASLLVVSTQVGTATAAGTGGCTPENKQFVDKNSNWTFSNTWKCTTPANHAQMWTPPNEPTAVAMADIHPSTPIRVICRSSYFTSTNATSKKRFPGTVWFLVQPVDVKASAAVSKVYPFVGAEDLYLDEHKTGWASFPPGWEKGTVLNCEDTKTPHVVSKGAAPQKVATGDSTNANNCVQRNVPLSAANLTGGYEKYVQSTHFICPATAGNKTGFNSHDLTGTRYDVIPFQTKALNGELGLIAVCTKDRALSSGNETVALVQTQVKKNAAVELAWVKASGTFTGFVPRKAGGLTGTVANVPECGTPANADEPLENTPDVPASCTAGANVQIASVGWRSYNCNFKAGLDNTPIPVYADNMGNGSETVNKAKQVGTILATSYAKVAIVCTAQLDGILQVNVQATQKNTAADVKAYDGWGFIPAEYLAQYANGAVKGKITQCTV